jgi:hypothetical protein
MSPDAVPAWNGSILRETAFKLQVPGLFDESVFSLRGRLGSFLIMKTLSFR